MKIIFESPTILEERIKDLGLEYPIPYINYGGNGYFLLPSKTMPPEINWKELSQIWRSRARGLGIRESDVQSWVDEYRAKKNV